MVEYLYCQTSYADNIMFCSEGGGHLFEDDKQETFELDFDEIDRMGDTVDDSGSAWSFQLGPKPVAIRLKIGIDKREDEVLLSNKDIHLGRLDPASDIFPEIDLSNDGSLAKSVSRCHAKILTLGDTVAIEDMGSMNGTFINGKRLNPHMPETLSDGDTLHLGKLPIEVKILTEDRH